MDKIEVVGGKGKAAIQVIDLFRDKLAIVQEALEPSQTVFLRVDGTDLADTRLALKQRKGFLLAQITWMCVTKCETH